MDVIAIADLTLADYAIPPAMVTKQSTRYGRSIRRRDGVAASVFVGSSAEPAQWVVLFRCPDWAARDALMATLDRVYQEEVRLLVRLSAVGQILVAKQAAIQGVRVPGADLEIFVDFETDDSVWEAIVPTTTEETLLVTTPLSHAIAIDVAGNASTLPVLRLTPRVQRTAFQAHAGWRYRRRWTITNNGDEPWFRLPIRISLGSTTALVSGGKALSSGNDLRMVLNGVEQARTLVAWNTSASHVWVVVPACAPGGSVTYDVIYGNPSAGSPPVLAYPELPAFDLASSTNASWVYKTQPIAANAGKGLWHLSNPKEAAIADFSVPGAWQRELTHTTPTNVDSIVQTIHSTSVPGGNIYAGANAYRWHTFTDFPVFPSAEDEVGWNPFDGVTLHHPLGISAVNAGFLYVNFADSYEEVEVTTTVADVTTTTTEEVVTTVDPVTRLVIIGRTSAAEPWRVIDQEVSATTTTGEVLAAQTFTPLISMKHIGFAVWPFGWASIPDTYQAGARIQSNTDTTVTITTSDLVIANVDAAGESGAEREVYELATELRLGGGGNAVPPYDTLLVGNARAAAGAGTPRCVVPLNETLVIDQGEALAGLRIEDAAGLEQEAVSQHVVRGLHGVAVPGGIAEFSTSRWLPLSPPRIAVPNHDFAVDISSWSLDSADVGMTIALAHDATMGGVALGSLKAVVSLPDAPSGSRALIVSNRFFACAGRSSVQIAAWMRTSNANLHPRLAIAFSTDDDDTIVTYAEEDAWTPVINTGYRRVFAATIPRQATRYRALLVVADAGGSAAGSVFFDDVALSGNDLYIADRSNGTIGVRVDVPGRFV